MRRHGFDALGFGHLVPEADPHQYSVFESALYQRYAGRLAAAARLR
jgi:hypothetical protein